VTAAAQVRQYIAMVYIGMDITEINEGDTERLILIACWLKMP
jgi:hypothetical protein